MGRTHGMYTIYSFISLEKNAGFLAGVPIRGVLRAKFTSLFLWWMFPRDTKNSISALIDVERKPLLGIGGASVVGWGH